MNSPAPAVDRLVVGAFMAAMVASGFSGATGYDSTRDVAAALAIRDGTAFPLHGPIFASTLHLGPLWFYVLALPLFVHSSWLAPALFVPTLGSLQFPLAYAAGRRLADRRFGLLWCALLALPGWGSFQLVGFSHTNMVPVTVMLVIYALVRLAQDRAPPWLLAAAAALSIAVHAHPSTVTLAPAVAVVGLYAIRGAGARLAWGLAALAVAAVPFAPLAIEQWLRPSAMLQQSTDHVEGAVRAANLAQLPALLYGIAVRGPRVIADTFCAFAPGSANAVLTLALAVEATALAGLAVALRRPRMLVVAALALTALVLLAVALVRPTTPFYMTYALVPLLAGTGALGVHALCTLAGQRGAALSAATVGAALLLHVATVAGIAATIDSGHVRLSVISRLDIKQDDPGTPALEPWSTARGIDSSGAWLCAQPGPVVLHATYAALEDMYLGLDHRLRCGTRNVRLIGAEPAASTHVAGLALPLWAALGWKAPVAIGGLGVAPVARVLGPASGFTVPDGRTYPPHAIASGPVRNATIHATIPADEVIVVSQPYALWTPAPRVTAEADGIAQAPVAQDAISAVYRCANCAAGTPVAWRIRIDAPVPERVDVVAIAPPR